MRFSRLMISNFKGITHVDLTDLSDTVVIAGPNGCGKSSIFDAIRLWKTAYGSYFHNEISNWYSENGVNPGSNAISKTLQVPNEPMNIYADFIFSEPEKSWIKENAEKLIRISEYRKRSPEYAWNLRSFDEVTLDDNLRGYENIISDAIKTYLPVILKELEMESIPGSVTCHPNGQIETIQSPLLSIAFSTYNPPFIGKFDYHGPQRTYSRETVGGINLQTEQFTNQRAQSALYNTNGKYNTVKSELASAYIKDLIAKEALAGVDLKKSDLIDTIKEMFSTFFPGKRFLGVRPTIDGQLTFDVRTGVGDHDINDLSSGEKEVIYGYLRIKNESPRNSIIMLDEPELHLNPRLTNGLPQFYDKYIGQAFNNQLWLVTHSDSILRQSVGRPRFSVFHMQPAGQYDGEDQLVEVHTDENLERAIIDLVGDLAAYKPNGKIVFVEGGGRSRFDQELITDLFPEFANRVNLISADNKDRVRSVHSVLQKASSSSAIAARIYSIADKDDSADSESLPGRLYTWNRYHVENYLLEEEFIRQAMVDLKIGDFRHITSAEISAILVECARETLPDLLRHEVEGVIQKSLYSAIKVRTDKRRTFSADAIHDLVSETGKRIGGIVENTFTRDGIATLIETAQKRRQTSLDDGTWKTEFRGRDVLKRFVGRFGTESYETFAKIIIARMRLSEFKPAGMKTVIDSIAAD